ncbi:cache domain-containing protein [Streptomyces sp. NPDC001380]|uniref:cache domain-containing protein n=1 Tax=Streptomyces sp. NPDC001380 TaxID=3364566 RepID=UPI003697BC3A
MTVQHSPASPRTAARTTARGGPGRTPAGPAAPAAAADPGAAAATAEEAVARVRDTLERVFAAVERTREAAERIVGGARAAGAAPSTADLAALRPLLLRQLAEHAPLISGAGFVAEPGSLADAPAWLEWWQPGPDGAPRPLRLHLDPDRSAYADYTHWDWFAIPRTTGQRAVSGPYVDYLCSDEYSLTLAAPVTVGGEFAGIAAADVYLRHFEAAVRPVLRRLPAPACLVNARGRIAASNTARHVAGSLLRGVDPAAVPGTGAHRQGGLELRRCGTLPLVLVTG